MGTDQKIDRPFEEAPQRTKWVVVVLVMGKGGWGGSESTTTKATNKVMVKCFSWKGIVPYHKISLPSPTLLSMEVLTYASPFLKHLFKKCQYQFAILQKF